MHSCFHVTGLVMPLRRITPLPCNSTGVNLALPMPILLFSKLWQNRIKTRTTNADCPCPYYVCSVPLRISTWGLVFHTRMNIKLDQETYFEFLRTVPIEYFIKDPIEVNPNRSYLKSTPHVVDFLKQFESNQIRDYTESDWILVEMV